MEKPKGVRFVGQGLLKHHCDPFQPSVAIIQKPVHWSAVQINCWFRYNRNTALKWIKLSLHTQAEPMFTYSGTFHLGTLFVFTEAAFQRCFLNYVFIGYLGTPPTSEIELFVTLVNDFQPLTNVRKNSILDVVWVLDLVFLELPEILKACEWVHFFVKLMVLGLQLYYKETPLLMLFQGIG